MDNLGVGEMMGRFQFFFSFFLIGFFFLSFLA